MVRVPVGVRDPTCNVACRCYYSPLRCNNVATYYIQYVNECYYVVTYVAVLSRVLVRTWIHLFVMTCN